MSLNDHGWGNQPGGGKRGNQGPPDLEELWRDFNRRLSGMFGKKGGGGKKKGGGGKASAGKAQLAPKPKKPPAKKPPPKSSPKKGGKGKSPY